MDIYDRGAKKWTSLMLPEHVEALKELFATYDHQQKPILDEQEMQVNAYKLRTALVSQQIIEVTYFKDHHFHVVLGEVKEIELEKRYVIVKERRIKLDDIVQVSSEFDLFY